MQMLYEPLKDLATEEEKGEKIVICPNQFALKSHNLNKPTQGFKEFSSAQEKMKVNIINRQIKHMETAW